MSSSGGSKGGQETVGYRPTELWASGPAEQDSSLAVFNNTDTIGIILQTRTASVREVSELLIGSCL